MLYYHTLVDTFNSSRKETILESSMTSDLALVEPELTGNIFSQYEMVTLTTGSGTASTQVLGYLSLFLMIIDATDCETLMINFLFVSVISSSLTPLSFKIDSTFSLVIVAADEHEEALR